MNLILVVAFRWCKGLIFKKQDGAFCVDNVINLDYCDVYTDISIHLKNFAFHVHQFYLENKSRKGIKWGVWKVKDKTLIVIETEGSIEGPPYTILFIYVWNLQ